MYNGAGLTKYLSVETITQRYMYYQCVLLSEINETTSRRT